MKNFLVGSQSFHLIHHWRSNWQDLSKLINIEDLKPGCHHLWFYHCSSCKIFPLTKDKMYFCIRWIYNSNNIPLWIAESFDVLHKGLVIRLQNLSIYSASFTKSNGIRWMEMATGEAIRLAPQNLCVQKSHIQMLVRAWPLIGANESRVTYH